MFTVLQRDFQKVKSYKPYLKKNLYFRHEETEVLIVNAWQNQDLSLDQYWICLTSVFKSALNLSLDLSHSKASILRCLTKHGVLGDKGLLCIVMSEHQDILQLIKTVAEGMFFSSTLCSCIIKYFKKETSIWKKTWEMPICKISGS